MLCLVPLLWAAAAAADEAKAAGSLTPLKLQVVFSRYQGEKKIGSLPYTLTHNANGELRRMRMGVDVPLKYEGPEAQGNVVFKSVGANVDCNVSSLDAGRFKVWCSLEQSSVHADGERRNLNDGPLSPPVLRSFRADTSSCCATARRRRPSRPPIP
jgi:hypothetical protein